MTCAECGRPIKRGEQVAWEEEEVVHVQGPAEEPCKRCFLVHRGECF